MKFIFLIITILFCHVLAVVGASCELDQRDHRDKFVGANGKHAPVFKKKAVL
jgi:hypothetical protein